MFIFNLWKEWVIDNLPQPIDYCLAVFFSIILFPVDLLFLPLEIIGLVLYKIFEK